MAKRKVTGEVVPTPEKPSKRAKFGEWLSDAEYTDESELEGEANAFQPSPQSKSLHDLETGSETSNDNESTNEELMESAGTNLLDNTRMGLTVRSTILSTRTLKNGLQKSLPGESEISEMKSQDNFLDLGVHPSLVVSLAAMSIRTPTPVQAACIPPLLKG